MDTNKNGPGRPRQAKVVRVVTIDEELAEALDSMPGERSQFVNDWLLQNTTIVETIMKGEGTMNKARFEGKRDGYAKAVGGFAIAKMSDGVYDWFPSGQPANVKGEVDKGAQIVEKWFWNGGRWKQIA